MDWINVSGNPEVTSNAVRAKVRANAMRYARGCHKRRASLRGRYRSLRQSNIVPVPQVCYHGQEEDDEFHTLRLGLTCLDSNPEPFGILPIPSSPRMLRLLQANYTSPIRTSVHDDPSGQYPSSCFHSPAWLYMSLSYASQRLSLLKTAQDSPERVALLVKSIEAVNETLHRNGEHIDNATIATVACLANLQCLSGCLSEAAVHLQGLQKMVMIQGGLTALSNKPVIRRMVQWSDLLYSSRTLTKPRFAPCITAFPPINDIDPFYKPDHLSASINQSLVVLAVQCGMPLVIHVLYDLHDLASYLNSAEHNRLPSELAYPDRVHVLEYSIITLLLRHMASGSTYAEEEQQCILVMLLHASLLFVYTNLRQTPVGSGIRATLVTRLCKALARLGDSSLAVSFPAERLWALLVALDAAKNTSRAERCAEIVRDTCRTYSISSFADAALFTRGLPNLETDAALKCEGEWSRNVQGLL